jgi:Prenyltransferase and squalene oxidase repeat
MFEDISLDTIRATQNADGGWPYRQGGSWTEPTAYAVLAYQAMRQALPGATLAWLRSAQQADGGWPPRVSVPQSTWVTALVALLPPEIAGAGRHARAVDWLLRESGMESTLGYRVSQFLTSGRAVDDQASGWPWFPGAAAWVTPTCLGILALKKCYWRQPSAELRERLEAAREFLFARRCVDGGWNHGSAHALGFNSFSYPETTGQALLALEGTDPARLEPSFSLARRFLQERPPAAGAAWLRLGLLVHQQLPESAPFFNKPCHTIADVALNCIARVAEQGYNVFLE